MEENTPQALGEAGRNKAWRGYLVVIVCLIGLAAYSAGQSCQQYRQQAEIQTQNVAQLLAGHVAAVVDKTDVVLRNAVQEAERLAAAREPEASLTRFLARQHGLLAEAGDLRGTDAQGVVRYGDGIPEGSRIDVSDRQYFLRHHARADAGLIIDGPIQSRITGNWNVVLSRRFNRPDGGFGGIIYINLPISHFQSLLASPELGKDGLITLRMADMRLIARIPDFTGTGPASQAVPREIAEGSRQGRQGGLLVAVSPADGVERTLAYRRVADHPLYIAVGISRQTQLAPWWRDMAKLAGIVVLFSAFALLLWRRGERSRQGEATANRLLREAVDSVAIGFAIFDAQERRLLGNRAFDQLSARPGPLGDAHGQPSEYRLPDGRHILSIEYRTPGGHIVCNLIDISELARYRDHLEQQVDLRTHELQASMARLQDSEIRYHTLFANMREGFAIGETIVGEDGKPTSFRFLEINTAFEGQTGLGRDILGRPVEDYLPQLEPYWVERYGRVALTGRSERFEDYNVDTGRYYEVYVFSPGDQRFAIVFSDVTQRRRMERALEESEAQFRQLCESLPQLIWTCGADGRCNYLSPQWETFTGIPNIEQFGLGWLEQLHPDDRAELGRRWLAAVEAGAVYSAEFRLRRQDGTYRWMRSLGVPLRDSEGRVVKWFGSCTDVHDLKRMQEALLDSERQLERRVEERTAQLMAANRQLESFTYAASHDMKGPLGRIVNFCDLLAFKYRDRLDVDGQLCIDLLQRNARRLVLLIDDLLAHARIDQQALEIAPVPVAPVLRNVLAEKEDAFRDGGAELGLALPDDLPPLRASVLGLTQVLRNLIENALKYAAHARPPRIDIGARVEDGRCTLWVRDNGIGFDMAYRDRIFEIFRRLHTYEEFPGSGVGLALVKRAMERMGGRVWAESVPGEGATFFIELPVAVEALPAPSRPEAETAGAA